MKDFLQFYKESFYDFDGRCRRSYFLGTVLLSFLIIFAIVAVRALFPTIPGLGFLVFFVVIVFTLPMISAGCKRVRDMGFSAYFLVALIPLYFLIGPLAHIALIVLGIIPGNKGENKFGDDPVAGSAANVFD